MVERTISTPIYNRTVQSVLDTYAKSFIDELYLLFSIHKKKSAETHLSNTLYPPPPPHRNT
jgi:hypothetical protein